MIQVTEFDLQRAAQIWCEAPHFSKPMDPEFAKSVAAAIAQEREACAQLCLDYAGHMISPGQGEGGSQSKGEAGLHLARCIRGMRTPLSPDQPNGEKA